MAHNSDLAVLLKRCLRLYFEMRVLLIRPTELRSLRRVAWAVSASTILTRPRGAHATVAGRQSPPLLSLDDLGDTLKAGVVLSAPEACAGVFVPAAGVYVHTVRALERAASCAPSEAPTSWQQLREAEAMAGGPLDLAREWSYVRVRALTLALLGSAAAAFNGRATASELGVEVGDATDSEQYCVCRGGDDGSLMVQCEKCEEWFHNRCVRYEPGMKGVKGRNGKRARSCCDEGKDDEAFVCISCCELGGNPYPYRWACDFLSSKGLAFLERVERLVAALTNRGKPPDL